MASFKDFPVHKENPYNMKGLGERFAKSKEVYVQDIDGTTGELVDDVPYSLVKRAKLIKHDRLTYIKLYKQGLDVLEQLNSPARTILFHIFKTIKQRQESVILHHKLLKGLMTAPMFYNGMVQLLGFGVISKGEYNHYYINPNMFYNGDRTKAKKNESSKG